MQSCGDGETRVHPDSWITPRTNTFHRTKTLQALVQLDFQHERDTEPTADWLLVAQCDLWEFNGRRVTGRLGWGSINTDTIAHRDRCTRGLMTAKIAATPEGKPSVL
jgi:hypothetical protein